MRYTALELFCGMGNNPQYFFGADLFSLGAVLFELFTRQILTQLVYDLPMLLRLGNLFAQHDSEDRRKDQLNALLPSILARWHLPDLRTMEHLAPASIGHRLNLFYRRLANLDYRQRSQVTFEWIFREIEICLKIIGHEERYNRWLELKRRQQRNRKHR